MKKKIKHFWFNFVYNVGFMALEIAVFYLTLPVSSEICMRVLVVSSLAMLPGRLLASFLYWGRMSKKILWMRRTIIITTDIVTYSLAYIMFGLLEFDSLKAYIMYITVILLGSFAQVVIYLIADYKEKISIEKINQKLSENQNN